MVFSSRRGSKGLRHTWRNPELGLSADPDRLYAFSMAKLRTTRTKTAQVRCVEVLDFTGVGCVGLYHVSAVIALITRPSIRSANAFAFVEKQN
jgi:hypothetical protein